MLNLYAHRLIGANIEIHPQFTAYREDEVGTESLDVLILGFTLHVLVIGHQDYVLKSCIVVAVVIRIVACSDIVAICIY